MKGNKLKKKNRNKVGKKMSKKSRKKIEVIYHEKRMRRNMIKTTTTFTSFSHSTRKKKKTIFFWHIDRLWTFHVNLTLTFFFCLFSLFLHWKNIYDLGCIGSKLRHTYVSLSYVGKWRIVFAVSIATGDCIIFFIMIIMHCFFSFSFLRRGERGGFW